MDYQARAETHKPKTVEEMRQAILDLIDQGYSDYGVGAALGIAVEQVRRLIGCRECG